MVSSVDQSARTNDFPHFLCQTSNRLEGVLIIIIKIYVLVLFRLKVSNCPN